MPMNRAYRREEIARGPCPRFQISHHFRGISIKNQAAHSIGVRENQEMHHRSGGPRNPEEAGNVKSNGR
jgi:hypothetical protein